MDEGGAEFLCGRKISCSYERLVKRPAFIHPMRFPSVVYEKDCINVRMQIGTDGPSFLCVVNTPCTRMVTHVQLI